MNDISPQASPYAPPSPPPALDPPPGTPVWGPWSTLGLGLAVFIVFVVGQSIPVIAAFFSRSWWDPSGSVTSVMEALPFDGDVLGAATVLGGAVAMAFLALLTFIRGSSPSLYLCLGGFAWWHLPLWLAVTYAAGLIQTALAPVFHQDAIPQFMVATFKSTDHPILLALGIAVAAPLFEEWFFRGFLHEGWRRTRLGVIPSILLTTLLWTLIHAQYGMFEKTWIFGFGILLCLAREWSGSLWPPIAMHVMNNGFSLIVTALEVS